MALGERKGTKNENGKCENEILTGNQRSMDGF